MENKTGLQILAVSWLLIFSAAAQSPDSLKQEPLVLTAKQDFVIYANNDYYTSFPGIILTKNQLVVYFDRQNLSELRASKLHPHFQPVSRIYYAVSDDLGKTWSYADQSPVLKDIQATTGPCYALPNHQVLQMTFRYIPGTREVRHIGPVIFDGAIYRDSIFEAPIEQIGVCSKPYFHDVERLADGTLIAAAYGDCGGGIPDSPAEGEMFRKQWPSGYRPTTVVFYHGTPDGRLWRYLSHIPNQHAFGFSEPAITIFPDGRIVAMLRTDWDEGFRRIMPKDAGDQEDAYGYYLYQTESLDQGKTWSEPVQLPLWGHPAHLVQLKCGNVLMVYGHRKPPRSIRAILSRDQCRSWDMKTLQMLKIWDPGNYDLGYPVAVQLPDGRIFCCFYGYSTEDVGEKMPHGIFGAIFKEQWLLQEQPKDAVK